jgi:hypothetical protein
MAQSLLDTEIDGWSLADIISMAHSYMDGGPGLPSAERIEAALEQAIKQRQDEARA